jgi:hypothetical protein
MGCCWIWWVETRWVLEALPRGVGGGLVYIGRFVIDQCVGFEEWECRKRDNLTAVSLGVGGRVLTILTTTSAARFLNANRLYSRLRNETGSLSGSKSLLLRKVSRKSRVEVLQTWLCKGSGQVTDWLSTKPKGFQLDCFGMWFYSRQSLVQTLTPTKPVTSNKICSRTQVPVCSTTHSPQT